MQVLESVLQGFMADSHPLPSMGKAWVKRWSPKVQKGKGSLIHALKVTPPKAIESIVWSLPPSKSHAIRWLILAAQSEDETLIEGLEHAGQDIVSMRRCLAQMGVQFTDLDAQGRSLSRDTNLDDQPASGSVAWKVHGAGMKGLNPPVSVLHAGNSGTTLRLLMALVTQFDVPVMLDGDASLRSRRYGAMLDAMDQFGVQRSHGLDEEGLPLLLQGPVQSGRELALNIASSSQPLSAWFLTAPSLEHRVKLKQIGEPVSRRHSQLSLDLCALTGAPTTLSDTLESWSVKVPNARVNLPRDASMQAFAFLAVAVTGTTVVIPERPLPEDSLGHEMLVDHAHAMGINVEDGTLSPHDSAQAIDLDLRDANDLITPVAALLALGSGGTLRGAAHAAHKESNRLKGSQDLLAQFGLKASLMEDGLEIAGGQQLQQPSGLVRTYGDHRMQMTALNLAMGCEGDVLIEGSSLHGVADLMAVKRWQEAGVSIDEILHSSS